MDLDPIGAHCSLPSCNELDFLPIQCRCTKYFCRHHITPESHSCPVDLAALNPSRTHFEKLQRCAVEKCGKPTLESFIANPDDQGRSPAVCVCQKSFCADHRHPKSHACTVQPTKSQEKNEAARALLAKNFSSSSTTSGVRRTTKVPTDPTKLAQFRKIELMKMRHRAIPGDTKDKPSSTAIDQRLHVRVSAEGAEKVLWFRKSLGTGRALDLIATHLSVSSISPLQLFKLSPDDPTGRTLLRNDQELASQVEDGCTLALVPAMTSS